MNLTNKIFERVDYMQAKTTLKQTLTIPMAQITTIVKNSLLADIDALAKDIESFFEELKPIAEQRFVMMKNKQVWYDKENAALFPKYESGVLQAFTTRNKPTINYRLDFEQQASGAGTPLGLGAEGRLSR